MGSGGRVECKGQQKQDKQYQYIIKLKAIILALALRLQGQISANNLFISFPHKANLKRLAFVFWASL
jgi:hypothetical protein